MKKPAPREIDDQSSHAGLPEGWAAAILGEITQNFDGMRIPVKAIDRKGRQGRYPYYGASGVIDSIDDYLFDGTFLLVAEDGANLLSRSTPIAFQASGQFWVNNHAHIVQTRGGIPIEYLGFFVNSVRLDDYVTGTAQPKLTQAALNRITVPLAPSEEQSRVVGSLRALLSRVRAANERIARVPAILKAFRQSVLSAAFSGRLTEDWREKHAASESAAAIIESLRRRREIDAKSENQKGKLRQIYMNLEENDSSELPDTWLFVTLNKLCASFDYGTSAKSQPSGDVPVLRMGNIQRGEVDWTDLVYTSNRKEIRQYGLQPNTVLFNRTNSPELVGKTAIYRGGRPAIFAGYLIRIVNLPELDPKYLNLCLNTNYAREFCSQVKTDGVSQSNINAQKLGMFELPFCPPAEQHEIVRRVDALFKLADRIEGRVKTAANRADKLTQGILARAFRGELVATEAELARREDRDYEPASVLLDRIKSDRVANARGGVVAKPKATALRRK